MAGFLRPAGCHRHQIIFRRAVSVIQGAGKSSEPASRADAACRRPDRLPGCGTPGTTTPRKAGCGAIMADAGQTRQDTRSTFAIVWGFLGDATLCRCGVSGASFFSAETRFFRPAAGSNGKKLRPENLFRATASRSRPSACPAPSERTSSRVPVQRPSPSQPDRLGLASPALAAALRSTCPGCGISPPSRPQRRR